MKIGRVSRPGFAVLAAAALGLGLGGVGPAASAAGNVPVSASLARPVVAASCSGGVCQVGVAEGATGFPISVTSTGVSGVGGAVPKGYYVRVVAGGAQVATGEADTHGAFNLTGALPSGQTVATIEWSQQPFGPATVTRLTIGAHDATAYLLASGGSPWSFGSNYNGGLGADSGVSYATTPVQISVPSGTDVVGVSGNGQGGGYAVDSNGHVWAWGTGTDGELGNGSTANAYNPVEVALPSGVTATAVAGGSENGYALDSDGHVWAWGYGADGELGNGSTSTSATPVEVALPAGVVATAIAGGGDGEGYALDQNGHVWAWGVGGNGELGNGSTSNSSTPVEVAFPAGVTIEAISGGAGGYALDQNGHVWAWGYGAYGNLGDGGASNSSVPVEVALPSGVTATAIAGGGAGGYALDQSGNVWAWGANDSGQLGNSSTSGSYTGPWGTPCDLTPVQVAMPSGVTATAIAGAAWSGYMLDSDGQVWAWGRNNQGQLGNGSTTNSDVPVKVQQ